MASVPAPTATGFPSFYKVKTVALARLRASSSCFERATRLPIEIVLTEHHTEKMKTIAGHSLMGMIPDDATAVTKLLAIADIVADRAEMHYNVAEQRDNWNRLLLISINAMTLSAATMTGLSAVPAVVGGARVAFGLSATFLYLAATALLVVVNKIQPSQLAEEQRNAGRLLRQLYSKITTSLAVQRSDAADVEEAMERILAIDNAYPLPLLSAMLEKFPRRVEPTVWWPSVTHLQPQPEVQNKDDSGNVNKNGWSKKLEEDMKEIRRVLEEEDIDEYMRLGKLVLTVNRVLAISGPVLTGLAAIGAAFAGIFSQGSWAPVAGVLGGAMASVVNTLEHGGQIGMIFEIYRNCAGYYTLLKESISSNLREERVERRDNGEVFEMKLALQLGRSLSELRNLGSASHEKDDDTVTEFAGKLF
ncbi:probable F-box protein At4g22030 [Aristolochia californica]|uniref:probable F-box protein At4g22030 n=1 Tax=Aristolochia californica TaxID=171875 RepID=UPI0035DB4C11